MVVPSISALDEGLGPCLQRLREQQGVSLDGAAARLNVSTASIRRMEKGQTVPRPSDLRALLCLYGVGSVRGAALENAAQRERAARQRGEAAPSVGSGLQRGEAVLACLEQQATAIGDYQGYVLPALVRTRAYMRAIYLARGLADGLEDALGLHERRVADALEGRYRLAVVVEESVLRRPVGDAGVMLEQLGHLLEVAALPHVTVQVIAADAGVLATQVAFTLLRFAAEPALVHGETMHGYQLVDEPAAVTRWAGEFACLQAAAVSGEGSRQLIAAARARALKRD
ncbi:helix-turn-helix transcriptional regulator [Nonomuraea sp. NPDC050202]|uniref:helix-turn-helix domain-containing protein n=1 Tax=Nonomuraea sp. NPDC050202 TaxID=3155035 RepID=UPI0033ED1DF1